MSLAKKVEIDCPGCNNRIPFQMWNGVNVNVNPELREKVLSGEIFDARCSLCGAVVSVVHPLLYNDMEYHFWVQLESQDADDSMLGKALPAIANQPMQGYRSRVVFDLAELKEKIMIFENGLDDRVMEVMKFLLRKNVWEAERPMLDGPLWFYELIKDKQAHPLGFTLLHLPEENQETFSIDWEQ